MGLHHFPLPLPLTNGSSVRGMVQFYSVAGVSSVEDRKVGLWPSWTIGLAPMGGGAGGKARVCVVVWRDRISTEITRRRERHGRA